MPPLPRGSSLLRLLVRTFWLLFLPPVCFAAVLPNIVVINSYAQGYAWSDDELSGVMEVLSSAYPDVEPLVVHLDSRRYELTHQEPFLLPLLQQKLAKGKPDLYITLDDAALDFALKHRSLLGKEVPVVFGGVNRYTEEIIAGQGNITGVAEESSFFETFELIRALCPETRQLLVVASSTTTGEATLDSFLRQLPVLPVQGLKITYYRDWTNAQLLERVSSLEPDTVGLLLETTVDAAGVRNYNNGEFNRALAERASRPLFMNSFPPGKHDWSVEPWGGIGGGLVLPVVHGRKVGDIALRVLQGADADSLPVIRQTPVLKAVDYRHLKRFGLSLASLPEGTVLYNEPSSFYKVHRIGIIFGVSLVLLLGTAVVILSINIFLRKRAEKAVSRMRAELDMLGTGIAQSNDLILILSPRATVLYANRAFEAAGSLPSGAWRGRKLTELLPLGSSQFEEALSTALSDGAWSGVLEYERDLTGLISLQTRLALIAPPSSGDELHILLIGRDLSRELKLEEQLRSSQKMEAVGLLAGGVAHDFNNILQVIQGHTALMLEECDSERNREDLSAIADAANRAIQLTRQLLVFSRKQTLRREALDLGQVVADGLRMIRRLIGEHIELIFSPCPEVHWVNGDRGQIDQVMLNLCLNARDAMPKGGRIVIEMRPRLFTREDSDRPGGLESGAYIELCVSDSGTGIPAALLDRIFDPFFTTKPIGQGTGLGLSVVYGIVKNHGGCITVQSEVGIGASFCVLLPECPRRAGHAETPLHKPVTQGSATILLAEDEEPVRQLAVRILSRRGYTVITASDGSEALEQLRTKAALFDLVILDVMMPKLSGREVYDHMQELKYNIPVLFCSGYASDMLSGNFAPDSSVAFLSKPYSTHELVHTVETVLQRPKGAVNKTESSAS